MKKLIWIAAVVAACGSDPQTTEDRRRFVEKTAHLLHPSSPPLTDAEIDALLELDDEEIVAKLYAEPATRDSVFKLSLAFLGAPVDQLHAGGGWAPPPFDFAPAVGAARTFRDGGDPLAALLTTYAQQPRGVVEPVSEEFISYYYPQLLPLEGTSTQKRAAVAGAVLGDVADLRAAVVALPEPFDQNAMCERYNNSFVSFIGFVVPNLIGVPRPVIAGGSAPELSYPDAFPLDYACFEGTVTTREDALAHIDTTASQFQQFFTRIEPIMAGWEADPEGAFMPVDFDAIGFYSSYGQSVFGTSQFYPQFWQLSPNSSTNYNRKRGAYVLDRFFCDDLKPVGAALPEAHGEGAHASDPACAACHFKLDPMAGFFRRNGYFGIEFNKQTLDANGGFIIFDDFAAMDYRQYEQAWRAPTGSGRQFDVGYIRSTRDESLNSYGDTLADLDTLLQTAPEVERCFTQRMFEFVNGTDQAVDPGFLDDVTADMHAAGANRLERGLVRVLTGNTFRAPDRNSTVCYDLAPGTEGAQRPPCEVASILRTHCGGCHTGDGAQAGLDLSRWESRDGGFGFPSRADRAETFSRMIDRLTTSDLSRQMPQAKDMPLRQREQLVLWLQSL